MTLHGETLQTDFRVINTGDQPFSFTAALHSYIEVLAVDKAKVSGGFLGGVHGGWGAGEGRGGGQGQGARAGGWGGGQIGILCTVIC